LLLQLLQVSREVKHNLYRLCESSPKERAV